MSWIAAAVPYEMPFLGGFNVPRPQLADIDGDGDQDLFIQERSGELLYFEREDSPGEPSYRWRPDAVSELDIGEWYRFSDIDTDGDLDLLGRGALQSHTAVPQCRGTARTGPPAHG